VPAVRGHNPGTIADYMRNERRDNMITLTKTMLEKSIIDCNAACREIACRVEVNFNTMAPGDRATVPAVFADGSETEVRFYKTNNARGDRRISIKGLNKRASIGDVVTLEVIARGKSLLIEICA
jgi:hypothetical protein